MAAVQVAPQNRLSDKEYQRRVWAWTMYDWANSAFVTTVLAAVLPVYFSQVAGSTLPSPTVATAYWSTGLSFSLFIIAILAPILGTISDVMRGKKRFLAIFTGIGVVSTALLVLVGSGDWILASILAIIGRIGFNGAITFYDSLLPHVAREDDQDRVSTRGYAMGYLGGGLLLAVNIVMIQLIPGTWGARLSFLSVAIWWAVFSIPLFRRIPEPLTVTASLGQGESILSASFQRLKETIKDIRRYRELFKYLIAFLIYNDAIGTIIGVAAIYGAELGFGSVELILALLLVQFVGIPYSLMFGRLPSKDDPRRPVYLAFVLYNVFALPLLGILGARYLPSDLVGTPPAPFTSTASAQGEGRYAPQALSGSASGDWQQITVSARSLGTDADQAYLFSGDPNARFDFHYNGQKIRLIYGQGPEFGVWAIQIDGQPVPDPDTGEPEVLDGYNPTVRYEMAATFEAKAPGEHTLSLVNSNQKSPESQGNAFSIGAVEVLPGARSSNLLLILGLILAVEVIGLALSFLVGKPLFSRLAQTFDTQRSIILSLVVYGVIAVWGFFLNSVIEFWCLAWMVSIVQGGSQALSRSLYAAMSPASKSGEFFGLYGIMEKFSSIIGPLLFAAAGIIFGSSRPAVLSLVILFFIGGYLLTKVNIAEGKRVAQEEDALSKA
jgi:UMF1 family MFS transporter